MNKTYILAAAALFLPLASQARPVSYPQGWTAITTHDKSETSALVHYSPTAKYSIGGRIIHMRQKDAALGAIQLNNLIKRWNFPEAQANLYLKSGIGGATNQETSRPAAFTGMAIDIEDRRLFASYENRALTAGDLDESFKQSARVGVAPYVAEYGDLHTWLMLQVDHTPGEYNNFDVKPLVRFFKGTTLWEVGSSLNGGINFNLIKRF